MPIKKPYIINKFDQSSIPQIDENFTRLYAHKLECRYKYEGSSTAGQSYIYNHVEVGQLSVSANGSATVVKTVALQERASKVLYAQAHAISPLVSAHVTDITATSITIETRSISGTGNFSAVTSASITIFFQVMGSNQGA